MPELTKNYKLKKPLANEYAKPDDFNENAEIIDAEMKRLDNEKADANHIHSGYATFHSWGNITVSATGWLSDDENGGFYQTIAVDGVLETDKPDADVVLGLDVGANELYLGAWSCVTLIVAGEDLITLRANKIAPTEAFRIQLKVVR